MSHRHRLARHLPAFAAGLATLVVASVASAEEGGLPQFNPDTFVGQVFWLVVVFGVLWFVMTKMGLPAVGAAIDARANRIQGDLDAATKARDEAKSALAHYEKSLADARTEAQRLNRATADAENKKAADRMAEVGAGIAKRIGEAEARIAAAQSDAMAGVPAMATEAARDAFDKLVGATADAGRLSAAIDAAAKGAVR